MRAPWSAIAFGAACFVVVASPAQAEPKRRLLNRVVAVVDDQCITSAELDWRVEMALRGVTVADRDPAAAKERMRVIRMLALDELIDKRLIVAEAIRRRLDVTASEVENALVTVQTQNGLDRAGFVAVLREQGFDENTYRRELWAQIAQMKVLGEELQRTQPGLAKLDEETQQAAMKSALDELVRRLRESRYVEVRL